MFKRFRSVSMLLFLGGISVGVACNSFDAGSECRTAK